MTGYATKWILLFSLIAPHESSIQKREHFKGVRLQNHIARGFSGGRSGGGRNASIKRGNTMTKNLV